MVQPRASGRPLSGCHGFVVVADGTPIGKVETPIFHGVAQEPDFLIVRVVASIRGTFRVVSTSLVAEVDVESWTVTLAITAPEVAALPEALPLADRLDVRTPPGAWTA